MSSSRYRVEFELVGNAGNIEAVLNRLNNGIRNVGNQSRGATNQMGLWQRQMMAMGTTARYALAGGVVFGVTAAIQSLSQFQVALGNIETVATRPGGIQGLGNQITEMGQDLIRISNQTITPVNDLAASVTTLYSSLRTDVPVKEVAAVTQELAKLARTTQVSDVQGLAGVMLGGVSAFGLPSGPGQLSKSVQTLANQFYTIIKESINLSGEDFTGQAGRLYSSARSAGLTPAQTGALAIQATAFGGTGATNMQNLSQLLIYLRNPKTPGQKAAYAEAGITEQDLLAPNGGYKIVKQLIGHAQRLGIRGTLNGQALRPGEQISDQDAANIKLSGKGAQFFARAFGRMQSQRTLISLASESLPELDKQVREVANSAGQVKAAFDRFTAQAPLAHLSNTLHNFALTSVSNLQPLLNPAARGASYVANQAALHPRTTGMVEGALVAALAGNALRKYIPGPLGKFLRAKNIGSGGAASAALTAEAGANILEGGPADGSRSNPFWVIIHPASNYIGAGTGGYGPLGGPGPGMPTALARRGIPKVPLAPIGAGGAILTGAALFGYGMYRSISMIAAGKGPSTPLADAFLNSMPTIHGPNPQINQWFKDYIGGKLDKKGLEAHLASSPTGLAYANWRQIQTKGERAAAQVAMQYAKQQTGGTQTGAFAVEGNLSGDFTVHLVDKQGNEIGVQEKKGVPTKLWGAKTVPQHRGKAKDIRKGKN